ncbi:Fusarinine C esterase sidJ [Penicillium canariense]|uniref:Fusarinine C esterase sidJ n=1 Tax=Penicillium canariense TaxID=189055 RepID=A0A9W9LMK3_9EURO|nr:Fusarinine C esterase sidJ [Penicillium canariense]KAJ5166196.1 Fusarinine C esterase sidJ [Penicillium canariense]
MYSKFWPKGGLPGILHHYTETLVTFEYAGSAPRQPHSILFVGGLGDGLATTSYMSDLVRALQPTEWSLFTLNLTSSYQSWGLGHLDRDTNEIAQCLNYIKDYKTSKFGTGKIVLMGHSTGSQCVMHYLYRPNPHMDIPAFDPDIEYVKRMPLDGAIMQAPVSDREAVQWVLSEGIGGKTGSEIRPVYEKMVTLAKETVEKGDPYDTMLPLWMTSHIYPANTAISCRRILSLISPDSPQSPGEDDLFSSDLSDEQLRTTFGMIKQQGLLKHKLMVLYSGADQAVPEWIDKEKLLLRWKEVTNHNGKYETWDQQHSAIIPGASHALSNDDQAEPRKLLVEKVLGYLKSAENV